MAEIITDGNLYDGEPSFDIVIMIKNDDIDKKLINLLSYYKNIEFSREFIKQITMIENYKLVKILEYCKNENIVIPFDFLNIFMKLQTKTFDVENAKSIFEYIIFMINNYGVNIIIFRKSIKVPCLFYIQQDIDTLSFTFKVLDFFFPEKYSWSNVPKYKKDDENINKIMNDYLDTKRV